MRSAPTPENESARLADLHATELLDSLPESDFDNIVKMAAMVCQTPIALISLVDEKRQWFKAKIGLDAKETPRDIAFCAHTILGNDLFLIEDASGDSRFHDNPLVIDKPSIKFYAGFPITTENGNNIGTVCVIDHQPRNLSSEQKKILELLSSQTVKIIQLRSLLRLSEKNHRALEQREAIVSSFMNHSPLMMGIIELCGDEIIHISDNPATAAFFHKESQKIKNVSAAEIGAEKKYIELWLDAYRESWLLNKPVKFTYQHHINDHDHWLNVNVNQIGSSEANRPLFCYVAEDITEQKNLLTQLLLEEERFLHTTEGANAGLLDWNILTGHVYFSDKWTIMLGYHPAEFLPQIESWLEKVCIEDQPLLRKLIDECVLEKKPQFSQEYRIRKKDGTSSWMLAQGTCFHDKTDVAQRLVIWNIDINQLKIASLTIENEKEKFENIVNNIPILLGYFNKENECSWVNREWEKTLGWSVDEMREKGIMSIFQLPPKQHEKVQAFFHSQPKEWAEFPATTRNGDVIETSWAVAHLSSGLSIAIGKNIHLEKFQQKLIQEQQVKIINSSKLSTLGEMASSIAHEINNPLAVIMGSASNLKKNIHLGKAKDADLIKSLTVIENTSERIAKIVKALRSYSRSGDKDPFQPILFSNILQDTLELCHERYRSKNIRLDIVCEKDFVLECRNVQIIQVLVNLLNNSYDAISERENPWIKITANSANDNAIIQIDDSGEGIKREVQENLMRPFFTTKDVGKGTGLGLSISKSIAEDHRGSLIYDASAPNTRFILTLPLTQEGTEQTNKNKR